MDTLITNALFDLYRDSFVDNIYPTLREILMAVIKAIENYNVINIAFQTFAGIAAALIIIFFYLELAEQVSRQMFSFEKLMASFIRLIACIAFCILLPQICYLIMYFAIALLDLVYDNMESIIDSGTKLVELIPGDKQTFEYQLERVFSGGSTDSGIIKQFRFALEHPVWSIEAFVVSLIAAIVKLVAYFMGIWVAVVFIARLFFAPIGVVNIYRGEQSSGVRYFKMLVASACTFVAMLVIVFVAGMLTQGLLGTAVDAGIITEKDLSTVGYYGEEVTRGSNTGIWRKTGRLKGSDDTTSATILSSDDEQYITYDEEDEAYYYYNPTVITIDISEQTLDELIFANLDDFLEAYNEDTSVAKKIFNGITHPWLTAKSIYWSFVDKVDIYDWTDAENRENSVKKELFGEQVAQSIYEPYFSLAFDFRMVFIAIIPQVVSIAGMIGASRLMNEVFGA